SRLIAADHRGLGMVTAHRYPLSECEPQGSPRYPTIARLLSERSSTGMPVGVDGINVHIRDDAINATFWLPRGGLDARPLIYGLALFARALGPDARLVALHVHAARRLHVKLWAVRVGAHLLKVVAINKGALTAGVRLALAARGTATVERLMAPSVRATSGVTLDGQWLYRHGRWQGRRGPARIAPSRGAYELALPGASAALVSLYLR